METYDIGFYIRVRQEGSDRGDAVIRAMRNMGLQGMDVDIRFTPDVYFHEPRESDAACEDPRTKVFFVEPLHANMPNDDPYG